MFERFELMAGYNTWMNERLYECASKLTDEERKADRGAFFGSIHRTLNHIMLADEIWLGRFTAKPIEAASLDQELHADFDALWAARRALDARIEAWVATLTEEALRGDLRYRRMSSPDEVSLPLGVAVQHFFNHQTHHRGQITTLLTQAGHDVGVTDVVYFAANVFLPKRAVSAVGGGPAASR